MRIRTRVLGSALAVVAVANIIYGDYAFERERHKARAHLQDTMAEGGRLLASFLAAPLYDGDGAQLERGVDSFFLNPDILRLTLKQKRGDVTVTRERPRSDAVGELVDQRVAIMHGGDEVGEILIVYSTAGIERHLLKSRNDLILLSLISFLGLAVVLYFVTRGLTRPIDRLTEAARALANGKLDQDIQFAGAQELSVLGESFLTMRDAIRARMVDLAEKNEHLRMEMQQRQTAEQERDRLISILEASTDYVSIADLQSNILYLNQGGRRLIGFGDQDVSTMRIPDVHPAWAAEIILHQGIPAAIRDGAWSGETALLGVDRNEIPVSQLILSHHDADGTLRYMSTVMRDIRERRRAEESLRIKDKAVAASINGIAFSDLDGNLTYVNAAFLRMWGLAHEADALGRSARDFWQEPEVAGRVLAALMQQDSWNGELTGRRRDGSTFIVHLSANVIRDASGQPVQLMASFLDISERKQAEEKLRASEARLAEAQRIAHIGSWELDLVANRLHWSDEIFRIFEIDPAQSPATYEGFLDKIHPDDRTRVNQSYTDSVASRTPYNIAHRLQMADGREKFVREAGETFYDAQGKPVRSLGTVQDITELKHAEDKLREYQEHLETLVRERTAALESAMKELEAFSYSVSHDLRAPLRAIDGFSRIILEDHAAALDAQGRSHFDRVRHAAQRMADLIDDLLDLSRIGRSAMRIADVDLSELAVDVVEQLRVSDPERLARVEIMPDLRTRGDARLLRLVVENLLGNAWKYTRRTAEAVIEFGAAQQDGVTVYTVADNGAGFDPAYVHKLFRPFQRLHRADEFEGTGVGLAIVARIVARHGGKIWTESQLGRGAKFHFTLDTSLTHGASTLADGNAIESNET